MINRPSTQPAAAAETPAKTLEKAYVKQLLGIMAELSSIMEEETPIIEARQFSKDSEFLKRKQELTLDYQSVMNVMIENQDLLKSLSKDETAQLRTAGQKLDMITEKNANALRAAHHSTEHLLKVVISEIRRDMHKASGYSGRGTMALAEAATARPVSINQRV
ncbi:MAG: hypothetical protein EB059_07675 [Alphaproteobacteria bacterium]|nr:hypothetical protein [Alphaproteobacteria bacterium]